MRRGYSREAYIELVKDIRETIPRVTISSDFITGFCGETEEEHQDTLSLMREIKYDNCFLYAYSLREKTHAHRNYQDDVPEEVKKRRLNEMFEVLHKYQRETNEKEVGNRYLILIEGKSRKFQDEISGRTDTNKKISIPNNIIDDLKVGDYVEVEVTSIANGPTLLKGIPIKKSSIQEFNHDYK
jgi:tRNA-2-methylthio-N6-dimethylallyladenosine synthase